MGIEKKPDPESGSSRFIPSWYIQLVADVAETKNPTAQHVERLMEWEAKQPEPETETPNPWFFLLIGAIGSLLLFAIAYFAWQLIR